MKSQPDHAEQRWIFDWSRTRVFRVRVLFAFAVALICHGLLLYLFRVSYPRSNTEIPKRYGITVLTESEPGSRRLLQEIADYHATYSGTLRLDSPLNVPLKPLTYTPSFENFELSLLPWPGEITPKRGTHHEPEPLALPPVTAAPEIPPPAVADFQILFQGDLAERPLLKDIAWTLPIDSPLAVDGLAEFTLSVTPEGNVAHVFLNHGRELTESEHVIDRLRLLQFEPRPSEDGALSWGTVVFRW